MKSFAAQPWRGLHADLGMVAGAWPVRAQFCGHVTDPHQACPPTPLFLPPPAACQQFLWHVAKKNFWPRAHFIIVRESTVLHSVHTVCCTKVRALYSVLEVSRCQQAAAQRGVCVINATTQTTRRVVKA